MKRVSPIPIAPKVYKAPSGAPLLDLWKQFQHFSLCVSKGGLKVLCLYQLVIFALWWKINLYRGSVRKRLKTGESGGEKFTRKNIRLLLGSLFIFVYKYS
uniref:Uncharacterized protein n=1 Tax=Cacopsylla melanoneura TaxID=428564 RepID=A0A8D8RBX5_9HEMI